MSDNLSLGSRPRSRRHAVGRRMPPPPQHGIDLRAALLVQTGQRALPARCPAPIRHHPAAVSPGGLQHIVEQDGVRGGVVAVDLVVGRHHRAGLGPLDGDLEGQQVRFAVRVGIDDGVQPVPVGFIAVQRIVLGRRDDTLPLDADDLLRGHGRAQQRVLGEVLEVAAVARVTRQVDGAGQLDVEPAAAGLPPDHLAGGPGQCGVESGGQRQPGGQRRGRIAGAVAGIGDTESGVAHPQRRNPQPRNAGHIAGAHRNVGRDALIAQRPPVPGAHDPDQQGEAFVVGHLGLDLAGPGVGV